MFEKENLTVFPDAPWSIIIPKDWFKSKIYPWRPIVLLNWASPLFVWCTIGRSPRSERRSWPRSQSRVKCGHKGQHSAGSANVSGACLPFQIVSCKRTKNCTLIYFPIDEVSMHGMFSTRSFTVLIIWIEPFRAQRQICQLLGF
jgi:hypothetical protein